MEYRYRDASEMKDSGIEWIGKIPKDWEALKLKRIIESVKNGVWGDDEQHNTNDIPCIRILNFNRNKMEIDIDDLTIRNIPIEKQKGYILKKGDLLIEKSGGGEKNPVGFVAIYNNTLPAVYANFMAKIQLKDNSNSEFVKYLCSNIYNKRIHLDSVNQTTGIQNLDTERYFSRQVVIPTKLEQEKIARFLDKKTSQFDSIISKKEALIKKLEEAKKSLISEVVTGKVKVVKTDDGYDLVKRSSDEMKDSGVEWLGEIPKDWKVSKFKYILSKIGSGKTPKGGAEVYQNEGVVFIRSQNVHNTGLKLNDVVYISDEADEEMKNSRVQKNDVLLNITGASIGRTSIFEFKDISANVNQHVCILRPIHKYILPRLLNKIIQSDYVQEQIQSMQTGSSREGLNFEQIANMNIVIDKNIENQQMIVKCLDEKINSINNLISKTKLQIEKLKEAKQSLISEAVTGKIEILD